MPALLRPLEELPLSREADTFDESLHMLGLGLDTIGHMLVKRVDLAIGMHNRFLVVAAHTAEPPHASHLHCQRSGSRQLVRVLDEVQLSAHEQNGAIHTLQRRDHGFRVQ